MSDYTVADTLYFMFTTRRFSSGAPFALAGTPVVSAYENADLTQITAGVTLGVDHDGVTGLNLVTVAASGANGFEAGKDYNLVITTGTVDSVSVVGEVVGRFTLSRSAAAVDLANATDGLGAIKAETALIVADTGTDGVVVAAGSKTGYTLTATTGLGAQNGPIATVTTLTNLPAAAALEATLTAMKGATFAGATDSLEAIRDRGDAAWVTATGFATPTNITAATGITVSAIGANVITAASIAADAITDAKVAADVTIASVTGAVGSVAAGVTLANGAHGGAAATMALGGAGGLTANVTGTVATVTTLTGHTAQTGDVYALANGAAGFVAIDTVVDAVKVKTDSLTFTQAGHVDANIQRINDVIITGTGTNPNEFGV